MFASESELPEGLVYQRGFISPDEEHGLISRIEKLSFAEIKMHGVVAKRRAAHFGRNYEYNSAKLGPAQAVPEFLLPLRQRVGAFASSTADEFAEVLVTEYPAGAGIGWHRDAPAFDVVVGVSLLSECTMRFRPWPVEKNTIIISKPLSQVLEPRSVYILRGASRTAWQHHIPPTKSLRFSITFRTLRGSAGT